MICLPLRGVCLTFERLNAAFPKKDIGLETETLKDGSEP